MHSFTTKFGSKQVERASQNAFDDVVVQAGKQNNELGAIFCQLKRDAFGRFTLSGSYLPPEWSSKINTILQAYGEELKKEYESEWEDDIPF